VALAIRAPSIHNTQPWRFELNGGVLDIRADRERQLRVADPDGHSLMISCGALLALTVLALRVEGWVVEVARFPRPDDPDLLAQLRGVVRADPLQSDIDHLAASQQRRSERRPFGVGQPPQDVVDRLVRASASPGVYAFFPRRAEQGVALAVAVSYADRFQRRDADYLAEMARWTREDDHHADGVPASAVPHVPAHEPRHTDVPLRDFEVGVPGGQLIDSEVDEHPALAVVFTNSDQQVDRIKAGEAMMRLMIEAEMAGLSSCPLSQAVDMVAFRVRLQTLMDWPDYPQIMLRLGNPPAAAPAPLTSRRHGTAVLSVG
jgi:nitroreductase